jgi:tetratricopeptide (TPR) repeat protein
MQSSAELHSAVSPIFNRLADGTCLGTTHVRRHAGSKPAIQRIGNLRYEGMGQPGDSRLAIGHLRFSSLVLLALLLLPLRALPHDSPEHVVEMLTARMEVVGRRPDLLWRRATEHRVLGDLAAAASDLRQALKMDPRFLPALTDLSRVQLAQGRRRRALWTTDRAFEFVRDEAGRAPLRMLRAEVFAESGDLEKSLAECNRALRHAEGTQLDWYLTRSQIQCRLGRFNDAVAGLKQGFELTGSAVLEVECIDAMIDAGRFGEAMERIEPILAASRWQASWLVRRARVRLAGGDIAAAHADLMAAIRELNQRLNSPRPDPGLLTDRGLASALLGDVAPARRDLAEARKLGADAETVRRLEVALAALR